MPDGRTTAAVVVASRASNPAPATPSSLVTAPYNNDDNCKYGTPPFVTDDIEEIDSLEPRSEKRKFPPPFAGSSAGREQARTDRITRATANTTSAGQDLAVNLPISAPLHAPVASNLPASASSTLKQRLATLLVALSRATDDENTSIQLYGVIVAGSISHSAILVSFLIKFLYGETLPSSSTFYLNVRESINSFMDPSRPTTPDPQ